MIAIIFTTLLLAQLGDFKATSAHSQTLVGNDKTYSFDENNSALVMTGNNCQLTIKRNTGSVLVTGNNNGLMIDNNSGPIKYTGNDGKIRFGSQSSQTSVDYIGNGGSVQTVSAKESTDVGTKAVPSPHQFTGNGMCIWLATNDVWCLVTGNDNTVMIQDNSAPVNYIGSNGHVIIGSESSVKNVGFMGSGGRLNIVDQVGSC